MSDTRSIESEEQKVSRTTSIANSLPSLKTEEHTELYDHRQHDYETHSPTSRTNYPPGNVNTTEHNEPGFSRNPSSPPHLGQYSNTLTGSAPRGGTATFPGVSGISFDGDSEDDINLPGHPGTSPYASIRHFNSNKEGKPKAAAPHSAAFFSKSHQDTTQSSSRRGSHSLGIPLMKKKSRSSSNASMMGNHLSRTVSAKSQSSQKSKELRRRVTRNTSIDTDDSQASHLSQETEEDVCFPIQKREHTRITGIDFDELEEFTTQEMAINRSHLYSQQIPQNRNVFGQNLGKPPSSTDTETTSSSAALRYTPRPSNVAHGISFGNNRVEPDEYDDDDLKKMNSNYTSAPTPTPEQPTPFEIPNRFSFFSSEVSETLHAPDLSSLVRPNQSFRELFNDGVPTWWLDCSCPTDEEMRCLTKTFGIHPLTSEDIRMQETREKVELFKNYYFVCFHTFENDMESEDFLEPINVYIVVFANGILTFHFNPISHCANVRRRVRQLRDYVGVNADWICYALVDDITDSFAPVIQSIEYEADAIEDSVFMTRDMNFALMIQKIGEGRRKTMTLMRLLSGKADVIKMFAKRCQDDINGIGPALTSQVNIANLQFKMPPDSGPSPEKRQQPRADIAMYLGDIQDHIVTMFQNLSSYEKIFSRSHSNYLAQLQVESFTSNNKITEMLSKVTMIGTMLVPLNVITGLFGMNVRVPGQPDGVGTFGWFFGILGFLALFAIGSLLFSNYWLSRIDPPKTFNEAATSGTKSILNFKNRSLKNPANPANKYNKSMLSFFTNKEGRYD
ncbi:unnamed protein product [Kluyveromyces dobzhanskii CBS 2104]|uniref:WGS project CCBQ000000000 data, contig 00106 n=1 Tax=Kluyveromyces dobzhanskii CBS 2104 TaxID=1427455 RepID=A0A0A8L5T2_9SACH|nr:unnamed protein product [Kluyveromyces dobzhanskii CBS 2104]